MDDLVKKYPNDVRVVIKQFPLNFHKQARKASLYALAADRQGKYHEMSNMIFYINILTRIILLTQIIFLTQISFLLQIMAI